MRRRLRCAMKSRDYWREFVCACTNERRASRYQNRPVLLLVKQNMFLEILLSASSLSVDQYATQTRQ